MVLHAVPAVGDVVRAVAHGAGQPRLLDLRPIGGAEQFDRLKAHVVALAAKVLKGHFGGLVLAGIQQAAIAPQRHGVVNVAFEFGAGGIIRRLEAVRETCGCGEGSHAPGELAKSGTARKSLIHGRQLKQRTASGTANLLRGTAWEGVALVWRGNGGGTVGERRGNGQYPE